MQLFDMVIWGGAILTTFGVLALMWCILRVARAKRANLTDQGMRVVMGRVLVVNMAALAASTIGLMAVVTGIFLAP